MKYSRTYRLAVIMIESGTKAIFLKSSSLLYNCCFYPEELNICQKYFLILLSTSKIGVEDNE
jgi:hypothetical protein